MAKFGKHSRVLIVDDVDLIATTLTAQLKALGFTQVERAQSGEAALALIESALGGDPFGLLFLDLQLPDMSGLEILTRCRSLPAMARTPILMLSGAVDRDSVMRSLGKGATDYITKPCSPEILLGKLRRLDPEL